LLITFMIGLAQDLLGLRWVYPEQTRHMLTAFTQLLTAFTLLVLRAFSWIQREMRKNLVHVPRH
jgi:hypothetical protein